MNIFIQVEEKWISINDETTSFNDVIPVTKDTYILFYQQRTRIDSKKQSLRPRSGDDTYDFVDLSFQEQSFDSTPRSLPDPQVGLIDLTEENTFLDIIQKIRARYPTFQQGEIDSILQRYKEIPSEEREKVEDIFRFPMRNRLDFITGNFGGVYKERFVTLRDKAWINGEVKLFLK